MVEAAVDLGASSDATAFGVRDARRTEGRGQTPVPVFRHHLLEREGLQGIGIDPRPFLHDSHVTPCTGERGRGDGSSCTRSDHEHVGGELLHREASGTSSFSANTTSEWNTRTY